MRELEKSSGGGLNSEFTPFELKVIRDTFTGLGWLTRDQDIVVKDVVRKCNERLEQHIVQAFQSVYRPGRG
jgi:hypothetical protein